MNKKATTNRQGFDNVLSHFHADGKKHGAVTALANAIPVSSRQVVDRWRTHGIPMKYAERLKQLTGLKPDEIWPENFK